MSTAAPQSMKQVAFGDLEYETAATRRVLERVPDEHLAWKPHEKSFSLGDLATHVANLLFWQRTILEEDGFDVAAVPPAAAAADRETLLRTFDENHAAVRAAFERIDDARFAEPWTLRSGEHVIFTQPRGQVMRGMGINHLVHHRAQLTVYLRMLDVPLPGIYGPSADEPM
jgi:uncharacterized damage-inducible protein DinB